MEVIRLVSTAGEEVGVVVELVVVVWVDDGR